MRNAGHTTRGAPWAFPLRAVDEPGWHARLRNMLRKSKWYYRLPLWLYLVYVGVRQYLEPVDYGSIFWPINLCIHEGGHLLCRQFPQFVHIAAGTAAQLLAPVVAMFILARQRDPFGITFCLGWLSTNFIAVGVYMADARARELPLVTAEGAGSSEPLTTHDWAYLFGQFGLIEYDTTIGYVTRVIGSGVMVLALVSGAWIMWEMALANRRAPKNSDL
jgi:hypothetical protein